MKGHSGTGTETVTEMVVSNISSLWAPPLPVSVSVSVSDTLAQAFIGISGTGTRTETGTETDREPARIC